VHEAAVIKLLFAAALALLFLASWILLPAPNRMLLTLAVGAPEVSPWLALGGLVVGGLTLAASRHASLTWITLALSVAATLIASAPLARLPSVVRRFDAAMTASLGQDFLRGVPPARLADMQPSPVSAVSLLIGFTSSDAIATRGIPFATPAGVRLTLDVYQPPSNGPHPVVVQIYGGAWQRGAPEDDARLASLLADKGFLVFAIDYRHAPQWQWPAQIDDVRSAIGWIREHAAERGGDPSRLALLGRSAGAHLALLAAYDPKSAPIAAVVSYYGPVDLTDGYRNPPSPDPLDVRSIEEAFLGGTPDQFADRYREASPITHVSGQVPPSLLIYGSRDHIVLSRFGAMLDARLRAAGATSVFLQIPWAEHAFDAIPNGLSGQLSLYYTERFLAWALTRAAADRRP
jgi:acetyl esterase/lipase